LSSDNDEDQEIDVFTRFTNKGGILVDERQLELENAYMPPERPEQKKKQNLQRMDVMRIFDSAQALLVNYLHGDYNFFLKKILGLV
jgi:hypothetical protein